MFPGRSGEKMESLRSKVILVTGANGFIGSHLTRKLLKEGAEVHVLLKKDFNQFRIKDILKNLTLWYGDLRDFQSICSCIKNSRPQIIFHLAALLNVSRASELIESMIDVNIKGTLNLLRGVIKENITLEFFINTGAQRNTVTVPFHSVKIRERYLFLLIRPVRLQRPIFVR